MQESKSEDWDVIQGVTVRKFRYMTNSDRAAAVSLVKAGYSYGAVAKQLRLSKTQVRRACRRVGLAANGNDSTVKLTPGRKVKPPSLAMTRAIELVKVGVSIAEAAARCSCNYPELLRHLRRLGIKAPNPIPRRKT